MSRSLINKFGQTITVLRDTNPEQTVKGKRVPDERETLTMVASVQPLRPNEIIEDVGPERTAASVKVYSYDPLYVNRTDLKLKADIIVYQDQHWEVRQVDIWQKNKRSIEFYKAIAVKVNKELEP